MGIIKMIQLRYQHQQPEKIFMWIKSAIAAALTSRRHSVEAFVQELLLSVYKSKDYFPISEKKTILQHNNRWRNEKTSFSTECQIRFYFKWHAMLFKPLHCTLTECCRRNKSATKAWRANNAVQNSKLNEVSKISRWVRLCSMLYLFYSLFHTSLSLFLYPIICLLRGLILSYVKYIFLKTLWVLQEENKLAVRIVQILMNRLYSTFTESEFVFK